ncbi:Myb-like DNA-binding domain containing protein [Tritrichomonas foetus]|uniref:Myb-like DNA-binding domain containing protein n=1 Tax=Tritrichomonas foetus TaxID=1144522 RepID=A0A1J4KQA8_9EUKA|nr:Myb-like DNA-binding domain containing protein [Tritrichomonas foetus]|eukprot:OHT13489.1 Myb-like DNA-binding domain containing protein [Tritrichomonas foetus]
MDNPLKDVVKSYIDVDVDNSLIQPENKEKATAILIHMLNKANSNQEEIYEVFSLIGTYEPYFKVQKIIDEQKRPIPIFPKSHIRKEIANTVRIGQSWSIYEDLRLLAAINKFGLNQWNKISHFVGYGRTKSQCSQRWFRVINPKIRKEPWTKEEEENLLRLVKIHGEKRWKDIANDMNYSRSDAQCRYHYNKLKKKMMKESVSTNINNTNELLNNQLLNKKMICELVKPDTNEDSHIFDFLIDMDFSKNTEMLKFGKDCGFPNENGFF